MNRSKEASGYRQHLYFTLFEPEDQKIRATVLILHGMQEHSGRYSDFAKYVTGQGFAVLTYDHLGHGKTAKSKADLGFFQKNKPLEQVVLDANTMADYLEELHPNIPHFILGHSMGSFITRCLLQQVGDQFNGAVIVGTGNKIKGAQLAKTFFFLLNFFSPKKRSRIINSTFSKLNNKKFKDDTNDNGTSWLSLSRANREAFINDNLNGVPFTNNGFYTLLSLNTQATKINWAESINKNLPFLFVSGEDDPIGNFSKGVKETVDFLKKDGFANVSLNLYPKMRHEILNEDIKEQVYKDISKWLINYSVVKNSDN